MDTATMTRELKDVLEAFETSLATPVISGDLPSWIGYVQENWAELVPLVHQQVDVQHRAELKQISRENTELLPRVQQLEGEDESIREQIRTLTSTISRLSQTSARDETHETKTQENVAAALAVEGLAFLNHVRSHDVAVKTWLGEAFNRDNGIPG